MIPHDPPDVGHVPPASPFALRTAKIAERTTDPDILDELTALEDRVCYLEAAVRHVAERIGLDLAGMPDPLGVRIVPSVSNSGGAA